MNRSSISNPPTSFPTLLPDRCADGSSREARSVAHTRHGHTKGRKCCPFCGIDPIFSARGMNAGATTVECRNLNCPVMPATGPLSHAEAITAWNTRASPQLQSTEAVERAEEFLQELDGWEQAYPLSAFPEPDLKKAAALLKAGGMTLDAISASNMRHVVSKLAQKARAAITALTSPAVVEAPAPDCSLGKMHGCASTFTNKDGVRCCDFCGRPAEGPHADEVERVAEALWNHCRARQGMAAAPFPKSRTDFLDMARAALLVTDKQDKDENSG